MIGLVYKARPRWPKFHWVHEALMGLGHRCFHITSLAELREAESSCALILFEQRDPGLGPKQIRDWERSGSAIWAQWWFDLLWDQPNEPLMERFGPMLRRFDLVFVKERARLADYAAAGIRAVYLDQGCPADIGEAKGEPEFDVLTFGSSRREYGQRTADVLALVAAGFNVAWAGDGTPPVGVTALPWTHPAQLPGLISRAALTLCVDLRDDVDGYWSDRLWLALGAGACVVRRRTVGEPTGSYSSYGNHAELVRIVLELLARPEERRRLASEARQTVLSHNTYRNRCEELLRHVDRFR